jgi:preprotein translocase subunit YajC
MENNILLFGLPGGAEWIVIIVIVLLLIVSPILAIIYFLQAKSLRKENKKLLERLLKK